MTDQPIPTTLEMPDTVLLEIDQIKPYFNNPRVIGEEAVEGLRYSLENYGYLQPIVVDAEHVVIVGHTRLQALKQMGVTHVPVYISNLPEEKAREYRLVDNRTGEMTSWDQSALTSELRRVESELLERYFPDYDLEVGALNDVQVTNDDIAAAVEEAVKVKQAQVVHTTEVVCPSCFHTFQVRTDTLPGGADVNFEEDEDEDDGN